MASLFLADGARNSETNIQTSPRTRLALSSPKSWRRDRYGHFELEPGPKRDMDPDMLALHQAITERNAKILYRGTDVESYNDPRAVGLR
jgi:hypothetical protein